LGIAIGIGRDIGMGPVAPTPPDKDGGGVTVDMEPVCPICMLPPGAL
jgi:hypothetical protein